MGLRGSVGQSVGPLATHWADGQRTHVLPSIMYPRAEDRLKGPRGRKAFKYVDVGSGCYVVKRNVSILPVQEDAHTPGGLSQLQARWRTGRHLVLILLHYHYPVAVLWRQSHASFPAHGCLAHSQDPCCLVSNLHLPVMAAREETGRAQGDDAVIESFWAVRLPLTFVSKPHTFHVIREDEVGVGGCWIQDYTGCGENTKLGVCGQHPLRVLPNSRTHGQGCSSRL